MREKIIRRLWRSIAKRGESLAVRNFPRLSSIDELIIRVWLMLRINWGSFRNSNYTVAFFPLFLLITRLCWILVISKMRSAVGWIGELSGSSFEWIILLNSNEVIIKKKFIKNIHFTHDKHELNFLSSNLRSLISLLKLWLYAHK